MKKNKFLFLFLPLFLLVVLISNNQIGVTAFQTKKISSYNTDSIKKIRNFNDPVAQSVSGVSPHPNMAMKLDNYKARIQSTLEIFAKVIIDEYIVIERENFLLSDLLSPDNLAKKGSEQTGEARKQLLTLFDKNFTKNKLINAGLQTYRGKMNRFLKSFFKAIKKFDTKNKSKSVRIIVKKKEYYLGNLISKENLSKKYGELSADTQNILKKLFYGGVTEQDSLAVLDDLKKLEAYRLKIKFFLNHFNLKHGSFAKQFVIQIGNKIYPLQRIRKKKHYDKPVFFLSSQARTELRTLFENNVQSLILQQIWKDNISEQYRLSIKDILSDFRKKNISEVKIKGKTYSLTELVKPVNKNKTVFLLTAEAKTEFKLLENAAKKAAIDNTEFIAGGENNQLEKFFLTIKDTLSDLNKAKISEINIDEVFFSLTDLIENVDNWEKYADLSDEAKGELKILLTNGITNIKLIQTYKKFLDKIKNILQLFTAIKINKFTINKKTYSIADLNAFLKKTDSLQDAENEDKSIKLLANDITAPKLLTTYKNAYLAYITPVLVGSFHAQITKIKINGITYQIGLLYENEERVITKSFSALSSLAQEELTKLATKKITIDKVFDAVLDAYLITIRPIFKLFAEIKMSELKPLNPQNNKNHVITPLITNIETSGSQQLSGAKSVLVSLLYDSKGDGVYMSLSQLTTIYNNKLDSFFITLKSSLQEFLMAKITEVIIDGKSYLIGGLTASLWTDDATQVNDAQTELLTLLKYNLDSLVVKSKLDAFLTKARSTFKQIIQPNLQAFAHAKINKAQIGDQVYSLKALINVNNINEAYANMTGPAQTEFTRLWAVKINSLQLTTALENNQMEKYYLQIYDFFNTFTFHGITQVQIKDKLYLLDKLLTASVLEQSIYLISSGARVQLQTLFVDGVSTVLLFQTLVDTKRILAFQENWDAGEISSYLFWLPVFDIKEVKLSQDEALQVDALATAIETMLTKEKFDFTKLEGKVRKQLLDLLNNEGKLRAEKTFQDDVWRQIKNHQKWKAIEGLPGQLVLQSIKTLLLEIQDLGISKVAHPFFPEGYDLSFLQDDKSWKEVSFQKLLQGMQVVVNGINVEFYSHLFPNQIIFQVPVKKLSTVFSIMTISSIKKSLKDAIDTKLDSYKTSIQPSLKVYAQVKVNQFKIGEQVYQIDHLIKLDNLDLSGSQLSPDAKTQLKVLAMVPIAAQQLDEILIKILVSKEQKLKSVQDFNFKSLIISLFVAGSALILSSTIGGFIYFTKTKN